MMKLRWVKKFWNIIASPIVKYKQKKGTFSIVLKLLTLLLSVVFTSCYVYHASQYSMKNHSKFNQDGYFKNKLDYLKQENVMLPQALASVAKNGVLILSVVDNDFLEMTYNFWETSILSNDITNILFVSSFTSTCNSLRARDIPCYVYHWNKGNYILTSNNSSDVDPEKHKFTLNARTSLVYQALMFNYTILLSDVDAYYFKNPLDHLNMTCCDLQTLSDGANDAMNANGGFILLRPTKGTLKVYRMRLQSLYIKDDISDQENLNEAIKANLPKLEVLYLDQNKFASGYKFFENDGRHFASSVPQCEECVVIHDNYLRSMAAKIYRLKENLMWSLDFNGYYSDPNRKYLTYDNPLPFTTRENTTKLEHDALINAVAISLVLNRTLILPEFNCPFSKCSLMSKYKISAFDSVFADRYREHSFLSHTKVPSTVRSSTAGPYIIKSSFSVLGTRHIKENVKLLQPSVPEKVLEYTQEGVLQNKPEGSVHQYLPGGATVNDIKSWFSDSKASVIHFGCLYKAFSGFSDKVESEAFQKRLTEGLVPSLYRQF